MTAPYKDNYSQTNNSLQPHCLINLISIHNQELYDTQIYKSKIVLNHRCLMKLFYFPIIIYIQSFYSVTLYMIIIITPTAHTPTKLAKSHCLNWLHVMLDFNQSKWIMSFSPKELNLVPCAVFFINTTDGVLVYIMNRETICLDVGEHAHVRRAIKAATTAVAKHILIFSHNQHC